MKKKSYFFRTMMFCFMTFVSVGMLTACSSDDEDNNPGGGDSQPSSEVYHPISASTRTLLDITEKKTYSPTEFGEEISKWPVFSYTGEGLGKLMKPIIKAVAASRLPQMDALFKELVGTAGDGSRQWNIKRYVFTYKSISGSTGKDTTLVGSVIFPTNTLGKAHQVDVLSLYHHMDYLDNSWLASHSVTLMGMHALNNYAVIEPDGQGASPDSEQMTKENVQGDLVCLQMVDCILAALEVMRQEGVTLSAEGYINNWGTSLGACATTGFAQYMENDATPDLQMLFKLRASYIGAGPVKLSHVQGADYLMPNMPKQKYYEGWNPRLPFYMSTCPDDELIIYDDMKEYYTQLRTMPDGSVNPNVHWCDYKISPVAQAAAAIGLKNLEGMSGFSNHLLTAIVTLMAVSIAKDPADMEKILQAKNMFVTE